MGVGSVQYGPGVEISMRTKMMEAQQNVKNSTLRSAAAAQSGRTGSFTGFRSWIGSQVIQLGRQLAGPGCDPPVGKSTPVTSVV